MLDYQRMVEGPTKVRPTKPRPRRGDDEEPCVEVLEGLQRGTVFSIGSAMLIGRTSRMQLRLEDDGVSREHAKLTVTDDGIVNIVDLGSTNGTYVNGARVDVAIVREGDRIQIGPDVTLRFDFRRPGEEPDPSKPAPVPLELSPREREIAELVAEGLTNAQIGKQLHISPYTVMTHLSNVYARLEIRSRAALAKLVTAAAHS